MISLEHLFKKKPSSTEEIDKIINEVIPILESKAGEYQIVHSIIYSELPITISEYVFNIKEGYCQRLETENEKRINFLKNMLVESPKITKKMQKQYLQYIGSATIKHPTQQGIIFHTHPGSNPESIFFSEESGFSKADKKFSEHTPLGLIEYCASSEENPLSVHLKLSLCYKKQEKVFSGIKLHLYDEGRYEIFYENKKNSGKIQKILHIPERLMPIFLKHSYPLMKYTLNNATEIRK